MVGMNTLDPILKARIEAARTPSGQFGEQHNTPPVGGLTEPAEPDNGFGALLQRRAELIKQGYAPANPGLTNLRVGASAPESWWDEHFRNAELVTGQRGRDYPKLPDDYTPAGTAGAALSGKRRTHRKTYEGAGVRLQMPSATAIKRFSRENPGTFDVPVTVEGAGGTTVTGWVRVTRETPTRWTVNMIGDAPEHVRVKTEEAVAAVLEARRPSLGLKRVGDLQQARRGRLAAKGASMVKPDTSTWINGLGYNRDAGEMYVNLGGRVYGYKTTEDVFNTVKTSYSAGQAYNRLVKNTADRVPVAECGKCKRWHNAGMQHTCLKHQMPAAGSTPFTRVLADRIVRQAA